MKFDKFAAYHDSVQCPKDDVRFLRRVYRDVSGSEPSVLREDFCGTFAICCEWVRLGEDKKAIGVDIDPMPLAYGKKHYLSKLNDSQRGRIHTLRKDVLSYSGEKADISCALNFSYYIFHSRETLLRYFKSCRRSLRPGGIMIIDSFGGPKCGESSVEVKRLPGLTYYWEQEDFDPINNRARFYIHFKTRGGHKHMRAFSYDWRMWTIPELRDVMIDAGFRDVLVYWEGTAADGNGNGKYHRRKKGDSSEAWIAYIVGCV
jgi:SAM-dependent methyltransferase